MAFSWTNDAIPNLLIGLFLCGLVAKLWRLRRLPVGRVLLAAAAGIATLATTVALGLLAEGEGEVVQLSGKALATGIIPLAATLALVAVIFGLRRSGMLDTARLEGVGVIENMNDGVVLLDECDRLIALNRAARRMLNLVDATRNAQPVAELLVEQPALLGKLRHAPAGRIEIESCDERGERSTCDVEISLLTERKMKRGRSVVLRDVSELKRAKEAREREIGHVDLLLGVASAVSAASTVDAVLAAGLETICRCMGWRVGHVYRPTEVDRPELRSASIDYVPGDGAYDGLCAAVAASGFGPRCGPPGRAWWTHEVEVASDLASDPSHPRDAIAAQLGVVAAVAVPVLADSDIVAVLEFLAPSMADLDERTKGILKHLGEWIGSSIARRRADLQVQGPGHFDALTGLPNRELFRERLQAKLDDESARDRALAVLFVDVDGFRQVNETLGYGAGDDVLREVARRFHKLTRPNDVVSRGDRVDSAVTLSRLGGDEFLLFVSKLDSPVDASRVAARLIAGLYEPIVAAGQEALVGASVGIAIYPDDGPDAESLIRAADEAMVTAKSHGGNVYRFYAETMNHLSARQLHLEQRLREAADREDWALYYQPVRNVRTGRVGAVEALLRWDYPDLGMVTPDEFLEVAEDIGLSEVIGAWVLREACLQAARWRDEGFEGVRISVNVSPRQILDGDLVASVAAAMKAAGLSGEQLELEIAESSIHCDTDRMRGVIEEIRDLGVSVALDGFGTGSSSLDHLRSFPIDRIKIDRSVVNTMEIDPSKTAAVREFIGLARQLRIGVVAEGVEKENELRLLRAAGCDELQGYLFSKPLPPGQVTRYFERDKAGD